MLLFPAKSREVAIRINSLTDGYRHHLRGKLPKAVINNCIKHLLKFESKLMAPNLFQDFVARPRHIPNAAHGGGVVSL
jgi:hypothetical protein